MKPGQVDSANTVEIINHQFYFAVTLCHREPRDLIFHCERSEAISEHAGAG